MKRLLCATTALMLLAPDLAAAQQQTDRRAPSPTTRPSPGMERPVRPPVVRPPKPDRPGRPQIQPPRPGHGGPQIQPPRPGHGGPQIQPPRPGHGGPQIQPIRPQPPVYRPRPPHRPGAGRPPHFRPIHGPSFHYPRGYRYRRWSAGLILPSLFLSSVYYYTAWDSLGVGPPPKGYRWVRYGPDLLLVRKKTGKIVDVIYGAFY
jgi:Ni/Co efflux regulator RcnB